MRFWALLVAGVCVLSATAWAEEPARLQERGEQLAKDGQFSEAIDAFKAADAQEPTTARACLIALAYSRRNLYGQADLYFDLCTRRATTADPTPSWVRSVERQFRSRLMGAKLARVTITVQHAVEPKVVVSAFAPDEAFAPRTIYLPLGRHTLTVTTADAQVLERAVIVDDTAAQNVVIDLHPEAAQLPTRETQVAAPSHLGRNLTFAGLGVAAIGGVIHATWYRSERAELLASQSPPDPARYDLHAGRYRTARYLTVGLYAAGALTAIAGIVLHATERRDSAPVVTLVPTGGGGVVGVEWSR